MLKIQRVKNATKTIENPKHCFSDSGYRSIFHFSFFIFQYVIQPEKLGGFTEGTEQYNGYRYAKDNQFKSVDQCDDEKDDPAINFNQDFFEGCKQYFNHQ
jgi:hypothetical protein